MLGAPSRREVLRLYRAILRRGDSLVYTDRDFFRRSVRHEFNKYSLESNKDEIVRHIEVVTSIYPTHATPDITLAPYLSSESRVFLTL